MSSPALVIADLMAGEPGVVFDVNRAKLMLAREAGVWDSARVLRIALETAVSGALMALSTDTLILKKNPKVSYEP